MLLIIKFIDGLPLARSEHVLARHGAMVPRQTLARWVIGGARLLQPLHSLMRDALFDGAFCTSTKRWWKCARGWQDTNFNELHVGANGRPTN